jgi:hypothetical protein
VTYVLIAAEDRTGRGLEQIVVKATQARRRQLDKPPLRFPDKHASLNGNTELLKDCAKYRFRRRYQQSPFDHVVYIMDARRSWNLVGAKRPSPERLEDDLVELERSITACMEAKAREGLKDSEWDYIRSGFHAHMLVWERESLILPVLSHFNLGPDVTEPVRVMQAAETLVERSGSKRFGYSKRDDGRRLLGAIAESAPLRDKVIQSNPSLQRIIQALVDL